MAKAVTQNSKAKTDKHITAVAYGRGVKISARKTRLVADLVRGKSVGEAVAMLQNLNKGAAKPVLKVLLSAVANAENNHQLKKEALVITKITVDEGPATARYKARAQGRAFTILRPSSHILVNVEEKDGVVKKSSRFSFPVILKREKKVKVEHNHKHEHDHEEQIEATEVESTTEVAKEKKPSKEKAEKSKVKKSSSVKRIFNRRGGEK